MKRGRSEKRKGEGGWEKEKRRWKARERSRLSESKRMPEAMCIGDSDFIFHTK